MTAQTIIAAYLDRCPKTFTKSTLGQLGRHAKSLLTENVPADVISRALDAWTERGNHPSSLSSFVDQVRNENNGHRLASFTAEDYAAGFGGGDR
ncbi:MAG: hypothetical protein ACRDRL_27855 [Sciscionella sp.]